MAIDARSSTFPTVVPRTVVNAARTPCVAPVEMTSVTIGPRTTIRTAVMSRNAVNRVGFTCRSGTGLHRFIAVPCDQEGLPARRATHPSAFFEQALQPRPETQRSGQKWGSRVAAKSHGLA